MKSLNSHSWFIATKKLHIKYELPDPIELLDDPPSKCVWKRKVDKHVNEHWTAIIKSCACLYSSLKCLVVEYYSCGRIHHLPKSAKNVKEINQIHTKIKIATGTYELHTNRAAFNQNKVDSTCIMCRKGEETMQHFLLECSELHMIRNPIMNSVLEARSSLCSPASDSDILLELIIDCSALINTKTHNQELSNVEFQTRRLCFALNCERFKRLSLVPRRDRTVKSKK